MPAKTELELDLAELKEEQDKIVKILNANNQTWDYAPSDGVLSLVERQSDELAALRSRVERLTEALTASQELAAFADHHPHCPNKFSRDCECGYYKAQRVDGQARVALLNDELVYPVDGVYVCPVCQLELDIDGACPKCHGKYARAALRGEG